MGTVDIRGDEVRIYKNGGSAELAIENATKANTGGFLKNIGAGLTEFDFVSMVTFSNLAAITAKAGDIPGQAAYVQSDTTLGDGGDSFYYWNATSTTAADGFGVIQATGIVTGRWIRVNSNSVFYGTTSTMTLSYLIKHYVYTSLSNAGTWTTPPKARIGYPFTVTNHSTFQLTVIPQTGEFLYWYNSPVTAIILNPGDSFYFFSDGNFINAR